MLKLVLFAALSGLAIGALDNMADRTAAAIIGLTLMGLGIAVAAKAASDVAAAAAAAKYKAEYNALATKWNKAHPKAKIALKK